VLNREAAASFPSTYCSTLKKVPNPLLIITSSRTWNHSRKTIRAEPAIDHQNQRCGSTTRTSAQNTARHDHVLVEPEVARGPDRDRRRGCVRGGGVADQPARAERGPDPRREEEEAQVGKKEENIERQ
jgi:hypothetical protein